MRQKKKILTELIKKLMSKKKAAGIKYQLLFIMQKKWWCFRS